MQLDCGRASEAISVENCFKLSKILVFWEFAAKTSFLVAAKPWSCCKALKHSMQLIEVVLGVFQLKTAKICLNYPSLLICCKSSIFEKLLQSPKVAARSCNTFNRSWQCWGRFFQWKSSVTCLQQSFFIDLQQILYFWRVAARP